MTDDDASIVQRLEALRRELADLSERTSDDRAAVTLDQQSVGRLSRMDALQAQAMAKAADERRRLEIARIDAAIRRVGEGTYGLCLNCEEDIEPGRLEVDPAATLCVTCARNRG